MKDVSESEVEDDEEGRAGAILKRPKLAGEGWSKTGSGRKMAKKRKKLKLQSNQS